MHNIVDARGCFNKIVLYLGAPLYEYLTRLNMLKTQQQLNNINTWRGILGTGILDPLEKYTNTKNVT